MIAFIGVLFDHTMHAYFVNIFISTGWRLYHYGGEQKRKKGFLKRNRTRYVYEMVRLSSTCNLYFLGSSFFLLYDLATLGNSMKIQGNN